MKNHKLEDHHSVTFYFINTTARLSFQVIGKSTKRLAVGKLFCDLLPGKPLLCHKDHAVIKKIADLVGDFWD